MENPLKKKTTFHPDYRQDLGWLNAGRIDESRLFDPEFPIVFQKRGNALMVEGRISKQAPRRNRRRVLDARVEWPL
jgi:hypothetical protein